MPKSNARAPATGHSYLVTVSELREIVKAVACPTCDAPEGIPCFNYSYRQAAELSQNPQQTLRKPRRRVAKRDPETGEKLKDERGRTVWEESKKASNVRPYYSTYVHADRRRAAEGIPTHPTGAARRRAVENGDWSAFVRPKYWPVVKNYGCPTCGAPAGIPCVLPPFDWERLSKFEEPAPSYHLAHRVHRRRYSQIIIGE